jgi:hypothetical protein
MTQKDISQKDKQLVFIELCGRLPYHVCVKIWLKDGTTEEGFLDLEHNYADVLRDAFYYNKIIDIKPYLRPLSSMTEEERYEIQGILGKDIEIFDDFINIIDSSRKRFSFLELQALLNWLNAHHFDYHGLIEKNLALDCTGLHIYD